MLPKWKHKVDVNLQFQRKDMLAMTLVRNRNSAVYARRNVALVNLRIKTLTQYVGHGDANDPHMQRDYDAYVARKEQEREALEARTKISPMMVMTRKRQTDGWSQARKNVRAGKLER